MIVLVDLPGPGARENPRSVVFQIDFSFNKFQKRKFIWIYVVLSKDRVDEHTISSVELVKEVQDVKNTTTKSDFRPKMVLPEAT